jgi:hypothetical protein
MARGRGRLREDDDEPEDAPQLPPSAVAPEVPELDDEEQAQRDLDDLLGELDPIADSEEEEGEDIFDEELLQKYAPFLCL